MRSRPDSTLLAVIDVQERLVAAVDAAPGVVDRCCRLARAAERLGVRRLLSEQYPKGLGPTVGELAGLMPPPREKMAFSGCGCLGEPLPNALESVVLAGLETHICIAQTALDLLEAGLGVFVAVDAVASRQKIDHEVGLRRLEAAGCVLVTSEAVLFEWCGTAEHEAFQEIRRLL